MKNLLILISAFLVLSFTEPFAKSAIRENIISKIENSILWVEWICDATGQWYKIIHYDDGTIKVIPVTGQGED